MKIDILSPSQETMKRVTQILADARTWRIFCHAKIDGDAIGSCLALLCAGLRFGKRVFWVVSDPAPPSYMFLAHSSDYIVMDEFKFDNPDELYVFLDSANENRGVRGLPSRLDRKGDGTLVINIDHHGDNSMFGDVNCVDPSSSSTSELMWRLLTNAGWTIDSDMAESLYTGIFADTGGFVFSNTTSMTHVALADLLSRGVKPAKIEAALRKNRSLGCTRLWGIACSRIVSWGPDEQFSMTWLFDDDFKNAAALRSDTEGLVGQLMMIQNIRFAVLLTEYKDKGEVKVSLRSRDGTVSAVTVAHSFGGGGHERASGGTLKMPIEKAISEIRERLDKAYDEWNSADR
ncbi:phosphoesterase [Synergistales bacterium]|nr:phosphoesterase [Synergistales bacterium]